MSDHVMSKVPTFFKLYRAIIRQIHKGRRLQPWLKPTKIGVGLSKFKGRLRFSLYWEMEDEKHHLGLIHEDYSIEWTKPDEAKQILRELEEEQNLPDDKSRDVNFDWVKNRINFTSLRHQETQN